MVIDTIANVTRLDILRILGKHGKMSVTEIYVKLRLEQSYVSQNLKRLRDIGLVSVERNGKKLFYSLDEKAVSDCFSLINELASYYKPQDNYAHIR